ncbi:hypothetical protein OUZ56_005659 [Daphnia magna]|uniref:Uncharacterized protein n=1 Tax=Daphnia magna TaxID=35525 RepID=A0ABQ9YUR7_9CRUS|nr:hypothetical protein OUZ56_005659 [Daphnia magna]
MAENLCPSVSSVKEKLKVSREREEECSSNLHLRRQDLLKTRTAAIDVVLAHQKAIVQLDLELEENSKDIKNVHVHFMSERETILNSFVGSLLKEKKKAAEVQPNAPQFVAPRHTPTIVCFLRTHLNQPGMVSCARKIRECDGFMLLTNRERMELLFAQHRCFGCFLPLSVAGHLKLADCPHPRFCAMCGTNDHHQILCAPRRYLWTGGPAVTYSAALTGRIVVISYKLITLIALSALLRVSKITAIMRTSIHCSASAATFSLSRPRKTQHDGPVQSISLPRLSGRNCPVDCLEDYLGRSKTLCPLSNSLFISLKKPYRPVGSSTIARGKRFVNSKNGYGN